MLMRRVRAQLILAAAVCAAIAIASTAARADSLTTPIPKLGRGQVANAHNVPISMSLYRHWFALAVAENEPHQKLAAGILPLAPPSFGACITSARAADPSLRSVSTARLRRECAAAFTTANKETLDLLLMSTWIAEGAKAMKLSVSSASVKAAYVKASKNNFAVFRSLKHYLPIAGRTAADRLFEVRAVVTLEDIVDTINAEAPSSDVTVAQVLENAYLELRPMTVCARAYAVSYCGATS